MTNIKVVNEENDKKTTYFINMDLNKESARLFGQ